MAAAKKNRVYAANEEQLGRRPPDGIRKRRFRSFGTHRKPPAADRQKHEMPSVRRMRDNRAFDWRGPTRKDATFAERKATIGPHSTRKICGALVVFRPLEVMVTTPLPETVIVPTTNCAS